MSWKKELLQKNNMGKFWRFCTTKPTGRNILKFARRVEVVRVIVKVDPGVIRIYLIKTNNEREKKMRTTKEQLKAVFKCFLCKELGKLRRLSDYGKTARLQSIARQAYECLIRPTTGRKVKFYTDYHKALSEAIPELFNVVAGKM